MAKPDSNLLTIQKFIYLLDDVGFREFTLHLTNIKATLPLKLAQAIKDRLPKFDDAEELYKKVYESELKTNKLKFNQLSSYTFKLSAALVQNYPAYLHWNIPRLHNLVNEGKHSEANLMAEAVLDIAERIDDFSCQKFALEFLCQQAFLTHNNALGLKLNAQLEHVVLTDQAFKNLFFNYRKWMYGVESESGDQHLNKLKKYYHQFYSHPSAALRIFSRYACLSIFYNQDPDRLHLPENVQIMKELERELHNYPHMVYPFMSDLKGDFGYLKLSSFYASINEKSDERDYEELTNHYHNTRFWRSYLSFWQLHLINIQVARLMGHYHHQINLSNYHEIITDDDRRWIKALTENCEELLHISKVKTPSEFEIMTLKTMRGALLILAGGRSIEKGIEELETLLVTYQQANKKATDNIYLSLMVGYFAIKEYDKCDRTFKRYSKAIKNKPVFEANHIKIRVYYYLAKWITTRAKQYPAKMDTLIKNSAKAFPAGCMQLVRQFQMPLGY